MQTTMKTIDSKINQIPDWLMGAIFGGLVYTLLRLLLLISPFFPSNFNAFYLLVLGVEYPGLIIGSMIRVHPMIAGSIPYLFIGGVMGALNKRGRIVFLLFLLVLALVPFAFVLYFIFSILWVLSHY